MNLNDLSENELQKLEDYVCSKLKTQDVKFFFDSLKKGKLKNKFVDIDALDFIHMNMFKIKKQ